jgi:hypothetical protein
MPENPMGAEIDPAVFKDKARHGITAETVRAAAQMLCPDDDPHVTQVSTRIGTNKGRETSGADSRLSRL